MSSALPEREAQTHPLPALEPLLVGRGTGFRSVSLTPEGDAAFRIAGPGNPVGRIMASLEARLQLASEAADAPPAADSGGAPPRPPADEPAVAGEGEDTGEVGASAAEALARARAEGFAAGHAEGRRAVEATFGMRVQALDRLLAQLAGAAVVDPAEVEPHLAAAALALVEGLHDEIPDLARQTLCARVADAATRLATGLAQLTLRLNPADHRALAARLTWPNGVEPVPDPAVPAGGFLLTCGDRAIEDTLAERLSTLGARLRGEKPGAVA